jgi:methyltransferase (TIGR00027 family)
MRKSQTSITAVGIAVLRADESEKPEHVCYDPYARLFVPSWFYHIMRFFISSGYAERRGKGVIGFLTARERYIDDYLARCLQSGIDQLVILGAGYDSRAYRFPGIRTFEVDHPATQQVKIAKVREIFGRQPENVTFVAIDFNQQSLDECLAANGYNPQGKTVFIWQGVTYYLDPDAVDSTLTCIANFSAPGSSVIFDYIDPALLARPSGHGEVKGMRRYSGMTGENLRFGIPVAEVEAFLTQRGFEQVQNVRSEELKTRYFHGKNLSRNVMSGYAIVSAVVR